MDTDLQTLLAALPEEQREGFTRLAESVKADYAAYGYEVPRDTPIPPALSLEAKKSGEIRNAERITWKTIAEHKGKRDLDDWFDVWYGPLATHERDLPGFAYATILQGCWTPKEERALAEASWTLPEWPGQHPRQWWLQVFNQVGFICSLRENGDTCDLHPAEDAVGEETVQVWRGAFASAKRGLSWTRDRERAEWFVRRGDMSGKGCTMRLWTATATPERVLAHFTNRSEDEFVLDTARLVIREEQP